MIPPSSASAQALAPAAAPTWAPAAAPTWAKALDSPRLGRFVLGPELGRGGMGVVHLAWDPMLRRLVALKQLLNADPLLALRFMREAQIQAKVEHPHICKVFEVGCEGGPPFIAMQYIQGQTLGESKEKLTLREKTQLMAEVAGAIHAAHRLGLVHRDLKPSNILLEAHEDGSWIPFILDFGLARDQAVADLTLSWGFVGTPAFMSPEQARAEEASPASDIYSLGATFYALYGGHPPFEATTLAGLINQQGRQVIRSLRRLLPGFPKDLDTILLKCMEPEPARRYASAFALEEDLRRWLAGEPIHARAIGPLGRAWRRIKRYRSLSLAIAAGLGLALALLAWNAYAARRARVQVELVQRFGLQVREVEQLLRIERMLPVHDMRPAEARIRQRMAEIQAAMANLGPQAQGPGHYALGRGYLALGEAAAAQKELEAAESHGFQTPEVSYVLASALLDQFLKTRDTQRGLSEADLKALHPRFVVPALAHLRKAVAGLQEEATFGEAQIAMLEGDYRRCVEKCREAFQHRPWQYEAKLLEARAWTALSNQSILGDDTQVHTEAEGQEALELSKKALETALAIAPSDEQVLTAEIARIIALTAFQSDSGEPTEEIFRLTEQLHDRALRIRPDSPALLGAWAYSRIRHGFVLLRAGMDPRPLMQDTLTRLLPLEGTLKANGLLHNAAWVYWILAEGGWRRGENPLQDLERMEAWVVKPDYALSQPLVIGAEYLASHGRNPEALLARAAHLLETTTLPNAEKSYYFHVIWGHVLLAKAEWLLGQGLDPLPTLDAGISHQETSSRLNPRVVYPYFFKAQFHTRRAQVLLSRGQDPEPDLAKALASARAARRVTASHHRVFLALAEAHHTQAKHQASLGLDPARSLQEARAALVAGFKINPTDFRLHREAAQVELTEARRAANAGESPLKALERAEQIAQKGVGIKADDAHVWLALARIQRLRMEWARKQGLATDSLKPEGQKHLARALAIHPSLAEALAELALMKALQHGNKAQGQTPLNASLK